MSQAADQRIPEIVSTKLAGLRIKMGFWLFIEALSRLLPTIVGLLAFIFVVDRFLEMDVPQRIIISVLAVLVLLAMGYLKLVKPFLKGLSDDALCLEVEKQNSDLHDSLISAVQFSRGLDTERQGISPDMVAATIEQGTTKAASLNFGSALNEDRYRVNVVITIASTFLLGAFVFGMLNNETMNVFMNRLFFYGEKEYAKNTYLEFYDPDGQIQDGVLKIYRGQDCKLLVHVREDSEIKDVQVSMYYRDASTGYWVKDDMRQTNRFEGREFEIVYKSVAIDFEVQARGGDGRTDRLKVVLEDPPAFSNLAAEVTYPDYVVEVRPGDLVRVFDRESVQKYVGPVVEANSSWEKIPDVTANGAKLVEWNLIDTEQLATLKDAQTKEPDKTYPQIARELDMFTEAQYAQTLAEELGVLTVRSEIDRMSLRDPSDLVDSFGGKLTILNGSSVRLIATANRELEVAELVHSQGPLKFTPSEDGEIYELSMPADEVKNGQYKIRLRDETMREPPRAAAFEIDIEADENPDVRASLKGISGLVISRAKIPFTVTVTDDFNVQRIYLKYSWQDDSGENKGSGEIELEEYEPIPNWVTGKPNVPKKPAEILPSRNFTLTQQFFDLDTLENKIPAGAGLNITLVAVDNDNVPDPNIGLSKEFLLRVVSEEEFRADLLRREKEARQEFDLIYNRQKETLTDTQALAADSKTDDESAEEFYAGLKKELSQYSRNQRLIGENVEGVIGRMEDLLTEGINNRLDESTGEFESRYTTKIIGPMQTITDEMMFLLKAELDLARRNVEDDEQRTQNLNTASEIQIEIIDKMEEILKEMEKNEGLQEIINKVFEAKNTQAKLKKQTDDERKKRIKGASSGEPGNSGSDDPKK